MKLNPFQELSYPAKTHSEDFNYGAAIVRTSYLTYELLRCDWTSG